MLGANDGILSTAAVVVGVAAARTGRNDVLIAGIAGARCRRAVDGRRRVRLGELATRRRTGRPRGRSGGARASIRRAELHELARIYEDRGVEPGIARIVAGQLMARDELGAHARDELGITDLAVARPMQAAWTSAVAFTCGAIWPVLAVLAPTSIRAWTVAAITVVALAVLGAIGATLGGASRGRAALRTVVLSSTALLISYLIGTLVGNAV